MNYLGMVDISGKTYVRNPDLHDLYDGYDLALMLPDGSRTNLHDLGHVFWVGSVLLYRSDPTTSHYGRLRI